MEMGVITAGTTLWHGTGAEVGFTMPRGPAWFSNSRGVAHHFAWLHGGWGPVELPCRVMRFEVVRDIELPVVNGSRTHIRTWQNDEVFGSKLWHDFLERAIQRDWHVEWHAGRLNLNRAICARFNGWHVVDNYAVGDDIMLCEPSRWVRRVQRGKR